MQGVALTSLWVAAVRAAETERSDSLFQDPFARQLAGDEGFEVARALDAIASDRPSTIAVRTRFLDDEAASAMANAILQVVTLAAGMDARAYRLAWPAGTTLFEIDQPHVLEYKARKLDGASPRCDRHAVGIDLREDWPSALLGAGFDAKATTLWLVEGLFPYLREADVTELIARISRLASSRSVLLFDVIGRSALESPYMKYLLDFVANLGAPWTYGTDEPEALLEPHGWEVRAKSMADVAQSFGRWPYPVMPRGTPGVPQSFLVKAIKRA